MFCIQRHGVLVGRNQKGTRWLESKNCADQKSAHACMDSHKGGGIEPANNKLSHLYKTKGNYSYVHSLGKPAASRKGGVVHQGIARSSALSLFVLGSGRTRANKRGQWQHVYLYKHASNKRGPVGQSVQKCSPLHRKAKKCWINRFTQL